MSDDLRRHLTAQIDALCRRRPPLDDRERSSIDELRRGLTELGEPCSQEADPTHVTASAIVVGPRGLLLHRHKRLGIWLQPGGHIDDDEAPEAAALREVREETGIPVEHFSGHPELVNVDAHPGPRGHRHLDLRYLLWGPDEDPSPPDGESPEVRWWSWQEAQTIDEAGLVGVITALMNPSLRMATDADAAAMAEVYLRSFGWAYRGTDVTLAHSDDAVREWIRTTMIAQSEVHVVAAAGAVIGYLSLTPGSVDHLYVDPAFVGRGIGTMLLDQAKARLPGGFSLWTFTVNDQARRFSESAGLTAVEFGDGSGNEEGQPNVRYQWSGPT